VKNVEVFALFFLAQQELFLTIGEKYPAKHSGSVLAVGN
jgi:hypothetical protein